MHNDTDKQPGDQGPTGAPEPDKLTTAQPAAESEAAAGEAPEAGAGQPEAAPQDGASGAQAAEEAAEAEAAGADEQAATGDAASERAEEPDQAGDEVAGEGPAAAEEEAAIAADLDKARAEAESYLDDLRRLQADFDNYRKRTLREQTARAASASQALVTRLLPVLDNFELAVSAAEHSRDFDRMLKGVEMVFGELREVLEGEGLVKIEAEGKPFDPERHEAVIAVEQEDTEPGTVVDIVRTGYELRGKVLRPAMVKVAK